MVEFDYTPRVAQETAGLGFVLPLPQRQQGIDVRNANPQTRASQAASMPFYQQAEDIDPTLTNLRDSYIADVQGLNALVQEAVSLGYDPRTIDYQDPQSIEVNKRYREMLEPIKQKEAQLRYAKPVTTRMRQQGQLYDPSIEDISALQGFGGAEDVSKAYNQSLTSMGYGQEGLQAANIARQAAQDNIAAIYQPYIEKFANNPVLAQSLNTMLQRDLSALEQALPKAPPKSEKNPLALKVAEWELKKEFNKIAKTEEYSNQMQVLPIGGNILALSPDGSTREIGQRYRAPLINQVKPTTSTAITSEGKKSGLKNIRYDGLEIVGYDKEGKIITGNNVPISQYAGFKVMAKGIAELKSDKVIPGKDRYYAPTVKEVEKIIDVFDEYSVVATSGDAEYKLVLDDIRRRMEQRAQVMTKALKGGAPAPAAQPARTQTTNTTDVSSIFGRP